MPAGAHSRSPAKRKLKGLSTQQQHPMIMLFSSSMDQLEADDEGVQLMTVAVHALLADVMFKAPRQDTA